MDCVFCNIVEGKESAEIVYEDDLCMAFLDKYPQSAGQLQLIPKRHYRWIYEIPEMGNFFSVAQKLTRVMIPALGADHVTYSTFGHMVSHAHLWIVPQYEGGASRFGEWTGRQASRESISEVAKILRKAFDRSEVNA